MTAAQESRGALLLALRGGGIRDLAILRAMEKVTREDFLPDALRHLAHRNVALPIACGQTMPPPLALAQMLEALDVRHDHRVFEIGTGSGYATAVLAQLAREVLSVERYRTLCEMAQTRLVAHGIDARIVAGDGLSLSEEVGRFDRIIVHGALTHIPRKLADVLEEGGRIVAGVVDDGGTSLAVFERNDDDFACRRVMPMRFAPMQRDVALVL